MTNRQCRHGFELSSCGNCMKDEIERLQRREQKAREILQPLADCDQAIRDWLAGSHHEPTGEQLYALRPLCTCAITKVDPACRIHGDGPEDSTAREPSGPTREVTPRYSYDNFACGQFIPEATSQFCAKCGYLPRDHRRHQSR